MDSLSGFQDNFWMDPLDGIAAFVRVVEGGSFSAAARHLKISKSAVSAHVQRLADGVGYVPSEWEKGQLARIEDAIDSDGIDGGGEA